jgi:hypothetical protein
VGVRFWIFEAETHRRKLAVVSVLKLSKTASGSYGFLGWVSLSSPASESGSGFTRPSVLGPKFAILKALKTSPAPENFDHQ